MKNMDELAEIGQAKRDFFLKVSGLILLIAFMGLFFGVQNGPEILMYMVFGGLGLFFAVGLLMFIYDRLVKPIVLSFQRLQQAKQNQHEGSPCRFGEQKEKQNIVRNCR